MAPRILVDATAAPADRGALVRYVDGLIAALHAAGADLAVACQRPDEERYSTLAPSARVIAGPPSITHRSARQAWEQFGLPYIAKQVGADVLHSPYYSVPQSPGLPTVVTIHDVTYFSDPGLHDPAKATYIKSATRNAARRATRLIVPSRFTRDEIVRLLHVQTSRVDVAHHGVDHQVFHRPREDERTRLSDRLGLHGHPYLAFLGTVEPRKNVPNLIRGWVAAVAEMTDPPALVLAGAGGRDDDIDAAMADVPAPLRVIRPGYLSWSSLPGFFGGATVVTLPSVSEGFGLPVLEAMACGAPVLTTHLASLPEVGGDAVAYTEPDPAGIGQVLRELIGDPVRRRKLGDAAHVRSYEFSWEACAEAHMASYERAIGK